MVSGERMVNKPAERGDRLVRLTFAQITLPDQAPQHVRAMVAVRRPMESLLAEEMSVSSIAVKRISCANVFPVRAHVGGGHFDPNEMRNSRPPQCRPTERADPSTNTPSSPLIRGANWQTIAENRVLETSAQDGRHDTEAPALTLPHNHNMYPLLAECSKLQLASLCYCSSSQCDARPAAAARGVRNAD